MSSFEKLGAFYLGKEYDLESARVLDSLVMYDARHLTTHAVCVGMTGAGKTGLCIDLLEEAAIDDVPAILIDPKGDITNLMLTFPDLRPEDFEPWVNVDDARRKGLSLREYAALMARRWREGLAAWGQDASRIRLLRESVDWRIYTPGSEAGEPLAVLASLRAPELSWEEEGELLRERVKGTVSALLGLVGVEADPLRNREHILLSHIVEHYWRRGEDLDLARLIQAIQSPPVERLGVFPVDTFFPPKERFELAMGLNNIVAAPSFAAWLKGEPLDVESLLRDPSGKPRHSIIYLAHLGDAERMFFVTLLLEHVLSWVWRQSGTTSLRAILYFDEVFGFLPPVRNPPSKRPLLTLLKQARAFGLGLVLCTQNPVDLDYKGLTNAGTWFIGKLQADRDKQRVLDGLESAAAEAGGALDRGDLDRLISRLGSRVFLLHDVHESRPLVFQTRWALSYLRGPLTRAQVRRLSSSRRARGGERRATARVPAATSPAPAPKVAAAPSPASQASVGESVTAAVEGLLTTPPVLPPNVPVLYVPVGEVTAAGADLVYDPCLYAAATVHFVDRPREIDEERRERLLLPAELLAPGQSWEEARTVGWEPDDLESEPRPGALFAPLPAGLDSARKLKALGRSLADHLYRERRLEIFHCPAVGLYGRPGEARGAFLARARQVARERRDQEVDRLRKRYRSRIERLRRRLERERLELEADRERYSSHKTEELLTAGETILGLLGVFGRRRGLRGLSRTARKRRMTARSRAAIRESEEEIARLSEQIRELRGELEDASEEIREKWRRALEAIEIYRVRPRRIDVEIELLCIAWVPRGLGDAVPGRQPRAGRG
jgi:hypothetical protein